MSLTGCSVKDERRGTSLAEFLRVSVPVMNPVSFLRLTKNPTRLPSSFCLAVISLPLFLIGQHTPRLPSFSSLFPYSPITYLHLHKVISMAGSKFPSFTHPELIKTTNPEGVDSVNRQKEEHIPTLPTDDFQASSPDVAADGPAKPRALTGTDLVNEALSGLNKNIILCILEHICFTCMLEGRISLVQSLFSEFF